MQPRFRVLQAVDRAYVEMPWLALPRGIRCARMVERLFGLIRGGLVRYVLEVNLDIDFMTHLMRERHAAIKAEPTVGGWIPSAALMCLYALVRWNKPRLAVETGVGPGSSASFILRAMQRNGEGRLYSIDRPGYDMEYYPSIGKKADIHVPHGFSVGWQIHPSTLPRWELNLGDAHVLLPELGKRLPGYDLFLHDSLHTYEQMMFEYAEARQRLRPGGLLLSDDVDPKWSTAFTEFCEKEGFRFIVLDGRFGIAQVT